MKKLLYIARFRALAVLLLLLLALAPARAQLVAHVGEITELEVDSINGDTYGWVLYNDSTVNFAVTDGTAVADGDAKFVNDVSTGKKVQIEWLKPGIYFFKVTAWDITGCTNNLEMGIVKVLPVSAKIIQPAPICSGETCTLTVELTGLTDSEWDYTVEFGPVSGATASRTMTVTGVKANPGENKATDYLKVVPDPVENTIFRVISVSNRIPPSVGFVNNIPTLPVTLIVWPNPNSSDIYKYYP